MGEKKIKIQYGDGVLCLPKKEVIDSLTAADGFNLKVLLLVSAEENLRSDYSVLSKDLCTRLDCTPTALKKAITFWQGKGVLELCNIDAEAEKSVVAESDDTKSTKSGGYLQTSDLPNYTEGEVADVIEKNTELRGTIDICQQIVGKIFTPAEAQTVVRLFDHLRLDGEYIVTLFAYCRDNGKKSLRYIEKTAIGLYDDGIDTTSALNEHIKWLERRDELTAKVKNLIGAASRSLTSKEKKAIEQWTMEWKFDFDIINRAYEVTVDSIGDVKLPYMNKVLENWHDSGLTTIESVESSLEAYKKNKTEAENAASGFDTDEFFKAAVARSGKYLKDKKS